MANPYDAYCDFSATAAQAVAGKDILLQVWDIPASGTPTLLAIAGQQSLTLNRSADSIEVSTKDTEGGWKSYIAGMKEWSIDLDGVFLKDDASHRTIQEAFNNGDLLCVKITNTKTSEDLFGGTVAVTDYPLEFPYDDTASYSLSLQGNGALVDLSEESVSA